MGLSFVHFFLNYLKILWFDFYFFHSCNNCGNLRFPSLGFLMPFLKCFRTFFFSWTIKIVLALFFVFLLINPKCSAWSACAEAPSLSTCILKGTLFRRLLIPFHLLTVFCHGFSQLVTQKATFILGFCAVSSVALAFCSLYSIANLPAIRFLVFIIQFAFHSFAINFLPPLNANTYQSHSLSV